MKSFKYQGYNQTGKKISGLVEAPDQAAAQSNLLGGGIYPSRLEEVRTTSAEKAVSFQMRRNRVKPGDLSLFIVQLAALADAGMTLDRSLEILANQKKGTRLGGVIASILAEVRSGASFSEAIAKHPEVFSELQIQMVHAGEISGHLEIVLTKLAEYSEQEETRRNQVKSALTYPALLICFAFSAVGFIISYVIPKMSKVFLDFGTELPWTTLALVNLSTLAGKIWPLILLSIAGLIFAVRAYAKTNQGHLVLDGYLLKLPLIGALLLKGSLARFSRTMAITGEGGVGVMDALEVAAGAAGNHLIRQVILGIRPEVREGKTLTATFEKSRIFPQVIVDMVAVGEETGNLDKMFTKIAEMYEFEVDTGIRRLLSLLEPALIIVMGVIVAFIVISVLVPLSKLGMDF